MMHKEDVGMKTWEGMLTHTMDTAQRAAPETK